MNLLALQLCYPNSNQLALSDGVAMLRFLLLLQYLVVARANVFFFHAFLSQTHNLVIFIQVSLCCLLAE